MSGKKESEKNPRKFETTIDIIDTSNVVNTSLFIVFFISLHGNKQFLLFVKNVVIKDRRF